MPAITPKVYQAKHYIEKVQKDVPFYVQEYINAKRDDYSPLTLSGYLYQINDFFDWLLAEGIVTVEHRREIPLSALESLKKSDVDLYLSKLQHSLIETKGTVNKTRAATSVARSVAALKSLFKYLVVETEVKGTGEPYFYRNVMLKVKTPKDKESLAHRSKRIDKKVYKPDEIEEFLYFAEFEYEKTLSAHQRPYFELNKKRDLAILYLLFGSGIRASECIGLQIDDIYEKDQYIDIVRKGNKPDSVAVKASAFHYINEYLQDRENTYGVAPNYSFVFVAKTTDGKVNQIANQTIIRMVKKVTKAYGKEITPHKARYSFAKHYQKEGGTLIGLRDQLGHTDISTTALYVTESLQEQKEVLAKMDDATVVEKKAGAEK